MRRFINLLLAGVLGASCYSEIGYQPDVVYAVNEYGQPVYYGNGYYWFYDKGYWYWWSTNTAYAPYGYYDGYRYYFTYRPNPGYHHGHFGPPGMHTAHR